MDIEQVIIIGGGIGGLTLASALQQRGIPFTLYEQSDELRELGAGIGLWSNAIRVLDALGYADALDEIGCEVRRAEIVAPSGRVLNASKITELIDSSDVRHLPRLVHRAELLSVLAEGVRADAVVTGRRCESVDWRGGRPVARFVDGAEESADLIVGADGLWSAVRQSLWDDNAPRYSGEYCWRGIAQVDTDQHLLRELQGSGRRFGLGMVDAERSYWWATLAVEEEFSLPPHEHKPLLAERFAGWPCGIPNVLAQTPAEQIHVDALYDRKPRDKWARGQVTLLGDAAHPTTPNLGQGACMAIEDAQVLADSLAYEASIPEALQTYERLRIPRTSRIVEQSLRFGRMGQWKNPVAVGLRSLAFRPAPSFVMKRQLLQQIAYDATTAVRGP
jgi:2-polyprenyl-6-methoxyphenol hydroxylase-like FAD-dependent oxidoreductase